MPFTDEPRLRYVGMGWYESLGPTVHVSPKWITTIPTGTRSDLASTPRIFWNILPPTGAYEQAAFVHDEGCVELRRAYDEGRPPRLTSREVDAQFVFILCEADQHACKVGDKAGRIPWWKRHILWTGVRLGALTNPARRAGWWRDAPAVLTTTALLLTALLAVVFGLDRLAHWIF